MAPCLDKSKVEGERPNYSEKFYLLFYLLEIRYIGGGLLILTETLLFVPASSSTPDLYEKPFYKQFQFPVQKVNPINKTQIFEIMWPTLTHELLPEHVPGLANQKSCVPKSIA